MDGTAGQRRAELAVFVFLACLAAPVLTVVGIGGYGLLIWLAQLLS